jgi:excisionase family DNA binding protein
MHTDTTATPLVHDVTGACQMLHIGRSTFYKLVEGGYIPVLKLGRRTLVAHDALIAYVRSLGDDLGVIADASRLDIELTRKGS